MADMSVNFDKPVSRMGTMSLKWDAAGEALPMWVADMDFPAAPAIVQALQQRVEHAVFGYSDVPPEWNAAYAYWWSTRHGYAVNPSWMVFCNGVIPALGAMIEEFSEPQDGIVVQTPVYGTFMRTIRSCGRRVVESRLRYERSAQEQAVYTIDWDDLDAKLADSRTTIMVLCNPHNPVGCIWDRETLARIGALCHRHGVLVISDEIHGDLTDPGVGYVPFGSVNEQCRQQSVSCWSASKAFNLAGVQSAGLCVPNPGLRERVELAVARAQCNEPNAFAVPATIAAFRHGAPWLDDLRAYLYDNKQRMRELFAQYNASVPQQRRVALTQGAATYLGWVDCSCATTDADAWCERLEQEYRVKVSSGSGFGGNGARFIRINVATQRARMEEGVGRIIEALRAI